MMGGSKWLKSYADITGPDLSCVDAARRRLDLMTDPSNQAVAVPHQHLSIWGLTHVTCFSRVCSRPPCALRMSGVVASAAAWGGSS